MGAATKLKAVCCYVACCGCFKICCKKSAPRLPGEKKESRLKRFRKFLNFGNFKLGILRRALWRKQAEERMNKLVEEEMLKMGKIAALAPVKSRSSSETPRRDGGPQASASVPLPSPASSASATATFGTS